MLRRFVGVRPSLEEGAKAEKPGCAIMAPLFPEYSCSAMWGVVCGVLSGVICGGSLSRLGS